jgi:hypothetical protein
MSSTSNVWSFSRRDIMGLLHLWPQ